MRPSRSLSTPSQPSASGTRGAAARPAGCAVTGLYALAGAEVVRHAGALCAFVFEALQERGTRDWQAPALRVVWSSARIAFDAVLRTLTGHDAGAVAYGGSEHKPPKQSASEVHGRSRRVGGRSGSRSLGRPRRRRDFAGRCLARDVAHTLAIRELVRTQLLPQPPKCSTRV